jgi:hypothetical protein
LQREQLASPAVMVVGDVVLGVQVAVESARSRAKA